LTTTYPHSSVPSSLLVIRPFSPFIGLSRVPRHPRPKLGNLRFLLGWLLVSLCSTRRDKSLLNIWHLSIACDASSTVITPPFCNLVLFVLRRRLSISFASRRFRSSLLNKITSCITAFVALVFDFKASIIYSGELLFCLLIRFSRYSDWDWASRTVFGVFETHGVNGWLTSPGGVGVRSCTSSFEIIFSGLKGASPAPSKPPLILLSVKVVWKAA
jgi:hypothetical protein